MSTDSEGGRRPSFGQSRKLSAIDRFGVWLSARGVRRATRKLRDYDLLDVGAGYFASLAMSLKDRTSSTTVLDYAFDGAVEAAAGVRAVAGDLGSTLPSIRDQSMDVVLCISVLEHLDSDQEALEAFHRILRDNGILILNVPSWRGKRFLEFSAFRLGLSPAEEMNDHKRYYDPRDLWPLLVAAGFRPEAITCKTHKWGLNTLAICRKSG